jgi:hypothetical protein
MATTKSETTEEKRLARYRRYNLSEKGQKRHQKYEDAHPERQTRWGVLMEIRKNGAP